jgi:hypothetical protein
MSFWDVHGYFGGLIFLFFLLLLPRLTLFFMVALPVVLQGQHIFPEYLSGGTVLDLLLKVLVTVIAVGVYALIPRYWALLIGFAVYWTTNPFLCVVALGFTYQATSLAWGKVWSLFMGNLRPTNTQSAAAEFEFQFKTPPPVQLKKRGPQDPLVHMKQARGHVVQSDK